MIRKAHRALATMVILLAPCLHAQTTVSEQYLLAAANQERAAEGLGPLIVNPDLTAAAFQHAQAMASHRTISHQFPGEPELSERGAAAGARFTLISENVAEAPSAVIIHDAWMHSPGHKANLLDAKVDSVGIAVIQRGGQLYAVQDFARITRSLTFAQQEAAVGLLLERSGLSLLPTSGDARETCATSSGFSGLTRPGFIMRYTTSNLNVLPSQIASKVTFERYRQAAVGACRPKSENNFSAYTLAILLYP